MTNDNNYQIYPIMDNTELHLTPKSVGHGEIQVVQNNETIISRDDILMSWRNRTSRTGMALFLAKELAPEVRWNIEECRIKLSGLLNLISIDEINYAPRGVWPDNNHVVWPLQARTLHVVRTIDEVWLVYQLPPSYSVLDGPQILKFTKNELRNLSSDLLRSKFPLMFETPSGEFPEFPDPDFDYWRDLGQSWLSNAERVTKENINTSDTGWFVDNW